VDLVVIHVIYATVKIPMTMTIVTTAGCPTLASSTAFIQAIITARAALSKNQQSRSSIMQYSSRVDLPMKTKI